VGLVLNDLEWVGLVPADSRLHQLPPGEGLLYGAMVMLCTSLGVSPPLERDMTLSVS